MLNKVSIIGNLGADPEIRRLNSGDTVVNLRVAVTEKWKSKDGERREKTEWIPVTIFNEHIGKVAEQYLRKGSKCYIEGQWQSRQWEDKEGQKRTTTEVVLQKFRGELQLLDPPRSGSDPQSSYNGERTAQTTAAARRPLEENLDDEIPF